MDIISVKQSSFLSITSRSGEVAGQSAQQKHASEPNFDDALLLSVTRKEQAVYSSDSAKIAGRKPTPALDSTPVARPGVNGRYAFLEIIRERVVYLLNFSEKSPSAQFNAGSGIGSEPTPDESTLSSYFSSEETAERIVNFALSFYDGSDPVEYADMVRQAVMKGYNQAKSALGGVLPSAVDETISLIMDSLQRFAGDNTTPA